MTPARLRIIKPAAPEPLDIAELIRADARKRDWGKVHVEADRRTGVELGPRFSFAAARSGWWSTRRG